MCKMCVSVQRGATMNIETSRAVGGVHQENTCKPTSVSKLWNEEGYQKYHCSNKYINISFNILYYLLIQLAAARRGNALPVAASRCCESHVCMSSKIEGPGHTVSFFELKKLKRQQNARCVSIKNTLKQWEKLSIQPGLKVLQIM